MRLKRVIVVGFGVCLLLFCRDLSSDEGFDKPRILDEELQEDAKSVAVAWFKALTRGDTSVLLSLSDLPFAFNGPKIIDNSADLKKAYHDLVKSKGTSNVQPADVTVTTKSSRVVKGCIPQHYLVVNLLVVPGGGPNVGSKGIPVGIRPGDTCKIVGFSKY